MYCCYRARVSRTFPWHRVTAPSSLVRRSTGPPFAGKNRKTKGTRLRLRGLSSRGLSPVLLIGLMALGVGQAVSGAQSTGRKPQANLLQENFPVQGACISANFPSNNTALKGLAIRLGNDAAVLFDTELLRMAAGWTGGYITTHGVAFDGAHGAHPRIDGSQKFGTGAHPGWADANGQFVDPRPEPFGPLPESWCRWGGHYLVGQEVVLDYTVLGTKIREQPALVTSAGERGFARTFEVARVKRALATVLCEADFDPDQADVAANVATLRAGTNCLKVGLVDAPKQARLEIEERRRVLLKLPRGTSASVFKVVIWRGEA